MSHMMIADFSFLSAPSNLAPRAKRKRKNEEEEETIFIFQVVAQKT